MVYKHQHFSLNTQTREVYDENNKLLRITGNVYRMLVFLCSNKCGTLTEIGDFLDRAKEYSEDHLRQYKYKINTILGHDVIKYCNNVYSIEGEITTTDQGNTDLLQPDEVKLNDVQKRDKQKSNTEVKLYKWPVIVGILSMAVTIFPVPYGIYNLNRIIITAIAVYYGYYIYQTLKKQDLYFWALVFIAILFNPIVPIHLNEKSIWLVIDLLVAIFFVILIRKLMTHEKSSKPNKYFNY